MSLQKGRPWRRFYESNKNNYVKQEPSLLITRLTYIMDYPMKLKWNIYEIQSDANTLHGVMLRGRIRKFTIENGITCLAENASDKENTVRFALLEGIEPTKTIEFIQNLIPGSLVTRVLESVENPILSKLKVNDISRYL